MTALFQQDFIWTVGHPGAKAQKVKTVHVKKRKTKLLIKSNFEILASAE